MKSDARRVSPSWDAERHPAYYNVKEDIFVPPITIISCGSARLGKGYSLHRDVSDAFGIEYVKAGTEVLIQDGKQYEAGPGEVLILRFGCNHTYGPGKRGWLLKRHVRFDGAFTQQIAQTCGIAGCDHVRLLNPRRMESYFREAIRIMDERPPQFQVILAGLAFEICVEVSRCMNTGYPAPVREAVDFIHKNLDRALRSEEIFAHVGLRQTHCNALFRKHVGVSPVQYHIRQRMAWASHLLRETRLSIKEVSAVVGYDDQLYFSAQFKKYTGVSPKKFRQAAG